MSGVELIIAGSYAQFRLYCEENELRPGRDAIYVSSTRTLRGRRGGVIRRVYGWRERPDLQELSDEIGVMLKAGQL